MKCISSFFLLLNFLCFQAQKQDSLAITAIEDVVSVGIPKVDCQKIYDKEKELYDKQFNALQKLNFDGLFDEIFQLKEFKELQSDERKILVLNPDYTMIISSCGNDFSIQCKHYEKNIQNEVFEKVWKKNNYLKIQKFFDNKVIIPLMGLPFLSFGQNMNDTNNYLKKYNIKPLYKGVYQDLNNHKKDFYYSSYQKPVEVLEIHLQRDKLIDEHYLQLEMKIFPVVEKGSDIYNVTVNIVNDGKELKKLEILYQYKAGAWRFLERKRKV